jgi:DNA repair exonuclease SbcCD ATPase subunit
MTHVKNADAFSKLVGFCTGYGGKYNPGRPNLRIESMSTQLDEVRQAFEEVKNAQANLNNHVNKRKQKYDQLSRLASSILRALEASGASVEKQDHARQFVHQMMGSTPKSCAPIPSGEAQPEKRTKANLQLAYVSKADSFSKLVKAVSTEPLYVVNEPDLSPQGLTTVVTELEQLNQQVDEARKNWRNTLIARNDALYSKSRSVYSTALAVKKYVRAIFGHDSAQYAQVKALRFVKPTK